MFYVLYPLLWVLSLLPLKILYLFSDFLYLLAYYIIRYRRKVVRQNLTRSFPNYTLKEIISIEKKFYRFFCDLMIEIIYNVNAPHKKMKQRMTVENVEELTQYADNKQTVIVMTGHYGNWEWSSAIGLHFPENFMVYPVYRKLSNKHFDNFMIKLRSRFGAECVEKDQLLRKIFNNKNEEKYGVFAMIADQTPRWRNIRHWVQFLNQDTAVFSGTEHIAKKYNFPVYYMDIQRVKRGYYHTTFIPIALDPQNMAKNEITDIFMKILEDKIIEKPEFWLWSHKRWKHKKEKTN